VVMPDDLRSGIRRGEAFKSLLLRLLLKCWIVGSVVSAVWLSV